MKNWIWVALALGLCGCESYEIKSSDILSETAIVRDVIFQPSQHGSTSSLGMNMDGDLTMHTGSIDVPEKYSVVFECQHGKFIISGSGEYYKKLLSKMHVNQSVDVKYREVHKIINKKTNKRGGPYEDHLIKYDFLDAN